MLDTSLLQDRWSEVVFQLPNGLDLDATAREHKALLRSRAIVDGQSLLRMAMLYGPGGASLRGASAWSEQIGIGSLSNVAVLKRLRGACTWLEHIAGTLMSARIGQTNDFRPLRLTDGSVITGPGDASWRLHATFDPIAGQFTHLEITTKKGGEKLARGPVVPNEIRIADRNFARKADMHHILNADADFIIRTGWRMGALRTPDSKEFDLFSALATVSEDNPGDFSISIVGNASFGDLPIRLIALRKPKEATKRELARIRDRVARKGNKLNEKTLIAADYTLILTSLPRREYSAERIAKLYQLRWQVELAFKRLKSIVRIDRLPAKDPKLARSWIATHLILALIIENLAGQVPDSPP